MRLMRWDWDCVGEELLLRRGRYSCDMVGDGVNGFGDVQIGVADLTIFGERMSTFLRSLFESIISQRRYTTLPNPCLQS